MYDQHVHSNYSIDSSESMEEYIKRVKTDYYTFTEHYDFYDPFNNGKTVTFDIERQRSEMDLLEEKYGVKLLQGIEVGYSTKGKHEIHSLLKTHSFDIILLSVHHDDKYDYMMDIPKDDFILVKEYFDKVEEALNQRYNADVFTHLEFGLRMRKATLEQIKLHETQIKRILNLIIENKMSLEINSKGFTVYNQVELYNYFTDLYIELGGRDFVVNSDAHSAEYYHYNFNEIYDFLKAKGISSLNYYVQRTKHSYNI